VDEEAKRRFEAASRDKMQRQGAPEKVEKTIQKLDAKLENSAMHTRQCRCREAYLGKLQKRFGYSNLTSNPYRKTRLMRGN
jgi:hypothetical protein